MSSAVLDPAASAAVHHVVRQEISHATGDDQGSIATVGSSSRPSTGESSGWSRGDRVVVELDGDELRIVPHAEALRRVRELIARHVPKGRSLADEPDSRAACRGRP